MADENKQFVDEFANPHAWLLVADNLHEQAAQIYANRKSSTIVTKINANREIVSQARGIDRPVFLLGGFALENAIKAFLVYENPEWVSNGELSRQLRSHSLIGLQNKSHLIPTREDYIAVLEAFESGLNSWFRYPYALSALDTKKKECLFDRLWEGYGTVMRAYSRELRGLLRNGWNGPHGTFGRWELEGEWLGYKEEKALSVIQTGVIAEHNRDSVLGKE